MHGLLRIGRILALAPTALAVAALFLLMVMTFFDVILRSTINTPIEAASELTRIMMAIIVFATLPIISARDGHITVDLLDGVFGRRLGRWRDVAVCLLCGAMLWWPAERVVVLAERAREYGDVTEFLGFPQFYVGWFVAVFAYLTMVTLLARALVLIVAPAELGAGASAGAVDD